ncbi:hypothetical protein BaRGS_00018155, partial [Batillaria attramentaria]
AVSMPAHGVTPSSLLHAPRAAHGRQPKCLAARQFSRRESAIIPLRPGLSARSDLDTFCVLGEKPTLRETGQGA